VRNYLPILIPIIVSSIRRALQVAESLESRAFGATAKRTSLYELKLRKRDVALMLFTTFIVSLAFYVAFIVPMSNPGLLPAWFHWRLPPM
jgi:energy-coupling factor transport system permease protein